VWFSVLWIFCLSCCIHFRGFDVVEWEVHGGSGWFKDDLSGVKKVMRLLLICLLGLLIIVLT
jgi:hypothetical protein